MVRLPRRDGGEKGGAIINTKQIVGKFQSLEEFERFRLEWTRICSKLNKHGKNAERLALTEERAKIMKL